MLRREDGFTMIEMVVAALCSAVVVAGLFTLIDTTLHSSTRTLTKVDATARARYTIEKIMNELHSSCLSYGATPIQSGSTDSSLVFTGQYGTAAAPTAVMHTIAFNSSTGTLTDASGSTTTTLLTNVSQSSTTPVFQYYAYEPVSGYKDSAGNAYMMLLDGTSYVPGTTTIPTAQSLTTPLSTSDADSAVEVKMTLAVGPHKQEGEETGLSNVTDTVTDSVVLRLTPAANDDATGTTFAPCE